QGRQFFSGVELQHELADLRSQLTHLGLVHRLLVFGARLEPPLTRLDERVHPPLDLGLLEIVLAAHVHELPLPPDQLKEQLHLPPRRPPLKLLRLHRPSTWTRVLYPVQSRRGTTSGRHWGNRSG